MSFGDNLRKIISVAAVGVMLNGPMIAPPAPAFADGAVSASTVYRARNYYGAKIYDLKESVEKGDFEAFSNKKVKNAFDLFISSSNALNSDLDKERKKEETNIYENIKKAVETRDAASLRENYNKFVEVAELKPDYKPDERGQTDSSGYAPTYGTSRQYIYQR